MQIDKAFYRIEQAVAQAAFVRAAGAGGNQIDIALAHRRTIFGERQTPLRALAFGKTFVSAVSETFATGRLGYVGLDVYGDEAERFYEDHSDRLLADPVLGRLLSMPNVIATSHQGFFTVEALTAIAETNVRNASASASGYPCTPPST